jgi:hypothetical protein
MGSSQLALVRGGSTGSDVTASKVTGSKVTGSDVTGIPVGVRMRNPKLRNIHHSGAFRPEVTLGNVIRRRGWKRCAHAQPDVVQYPP